ncbi:hypothetical protein ANTPLA_LOCUS666 [Anthophora plagiata]
MQRLWQLRIGWDESLPQEVHYQWCEFRTELGLISSIAIPRQVVGNPIQEIELHGSSDASERAYGAAVYLRARISKNNWTS